MSAYYSENDRFAAAWLRELIHEGLIAPGDVDERDIRDVLPGDLRGYTQCHFFAGIGGWSYALRLAGWPDDRPCWTGSCPCQPFSIIGQHKKFEDERHLWPEWFRLICEHRPSVIFGEQVANAKLWLDKVLPDLEAIDYACGTANLPACAVGLPHERQRLWFVADANKARWENSKGLSATETGTKVGAAPGLVHRHKAESFRWSVEPDQDWIVDGLRGEGRAVGAFGNAIVPQQAAAFIEAYLEAVERN